MVFDETMNVLKEAILAPNFMLPLVVILIVMMGPDIHMEELDVIDMFWNFRLSSMFANYYVVCMGPYLQDE